MLGIISLPAHELAVRGELEIMILQVLSNEGLGFAVEQGGVWRHIELPLRKSSQLNVEAVHDMVKSD
jgi:hypothetical protein